MDTYYASVGECPVAANKNHLTIWNGAASGKDMYVFRLLAVGSPAGTAAGLKVTLAALRVTLEPAGGTATAFAKAKPASADVPSPVVVRDAKAAAITVPGGGIEPIAFAVTSVNTEETSGSDASVFYKAPDDPTNAGGPEAVICPPGSGLLIRQLTLAGAGAVSFVVEIGLA